MNHNPRPFSFPPQSANVNPNVFFPPTQPPAPPPDIATTLSTLKNLITLSAQTLNSVSQNYEIPLPNPQNDPLVPCPFNPHHRMPPESLFLHSLSCPTPLDIDIATLHYPKTLKRHRFDDADERQRFDQGLNAAEERHRFDESLNAERCVSVDESEKRCRFNESLNDELCVSLDEFLQFGENFFYKDCPSVVRFSAFERLSKVLSIPSVLAIECRDASEKNIEVFDLQRLKIFPSEVWELRNEIGAWSDYPRSYSYCVLQAIVGVRMVSQDEMRRWVIVNSPFYGVVIEVYMRDHIYVLFRLCLKAIVREANDLLRDKGCNSEMSLGSLRFECPACVQVLSWLASQLSILYGEANGKLFTINMFKYCISESAFRISLYRGKEVSPEDCSKVGNVVDIVANRPNERGTNCKKNCWGDIISVGQIAAAVAALHERSMLEEKIRSLRGTRPLTSYERNAEHAFLTNKADEERRIRPNCRKIIDHDGLPRHRISDEGTNKHKTREELLAEERDYKRRRMSYRGKKVKRSALQVMRDIIEEYMDEIKQAGGIGCFEKGPEGVDISQPAKPFVDFDLLGKSSNASGKNRYREESHKDYDVRYREFEDDASRDYDRRRRGSHGRHGSRDHQSRNDGRHRDYKVYRFKSPERSASRGQSHRQSGRGIEIDDMEETKTRHQKNKQLSPKKSKYRDEKPFVSSLVTKRDENFEYVNGQQSNRHGDQHSDYIIQKTFPDRYDPSESQDIQEDYVYTAHKYVKPDEP